MRTLSSIEAQKFCSFEHIIIDGGSTDGSDRLIIQYGKKPNVVYVSESDKGLYDAMNKGLKLAKGEFIGFVNSGDFLVDDCVLANLEAEIKKFSSFDAYFGNKIYYNNQKVITRYWVSSPMSNLKFYLGWMPPHQATYIKRSAYRSYGLFDLKFQIASDYDLLLRLFHKNKLKAKKVDLDVVFMEPGGISHGNFVNILHSNLEVLKAWKNNDLFVPFWIFFLKPFSKLCQKPLFALRNEHIKVLSKKLESSLKLELGKSYNHD